MTTTWSEERPVYHGPGYSERMAHRPRHCAPSQWRATSRTAALSLAGLLFVALGVLAIVYAIARPDILKTFGT